MEKSPILNSSPNLPAPQWGLILAFLLVLATSAIASCGQLGQTSSAPSPPAGEVAEGGQTVSLQIVQGQGGAVLALIPVSIQGQGPFPFALDTGATTSLIDTNLATQLGLQVVGHVQQVTGVTGSEPAELVKVNQWNAGNISLPPITATSVNLPGPQHGGGLQGLLGSDVLSTYGTVIVDYQRGILVLNPKGEQ
ncbi:MAG: retropepsin-like domain-containing protein [Bacteroidetes bacterium]|nr:retropepsin-like domain-containing protein [Bacteroidota bacterium]MCL5025554.1 retropepsin-like domain-containing protein [Chloroflexota bacterium]